MQTENKQVKKGFFSRIQRLFGGDVDVVTEEIRSDVSHGVGGGFIIDDQMAYHANNIPTREVRFNKYERIKNLEADGIISSAISLLVTAALGGHETTGDVVFIEQKPNATAEQKKIITDLQQSLLPMLNEVMYSICCVGATYGDSYARLHIKKGEGVQSIMHNELTHPTKIVPYERGGANVGYYLLGASSGNNQDKSRCVLNTMQMARFKMPRTLQDDHKSLGGLRGHRFMDELLADDVGDAPVRASNVGGSLITEAVQRAFANYSLTITGMTMQRLVDSIDEKIISFSADGDSKSYERFKRSLENIFKRSKDVADKVVNGTQEERQRALLTRVNHFVPVSSDGRQSISDTGTSGSRRTSVTTIEDVMINARLLAGALGVDLSMLGFADQLAGGLGEGGFFRTSAQAAERARIIRTSCSDFVEQVIEAHIAAKYGKFFDKKDRPWQVNFFGSLSAFESEKRDTMNTAMGAGMTLVQSIQMLKDMGMSRKSIKIFLVRQMMVDEELADTYTDFEATQNEEEEM